MWWMLIDGRAMDGQLSANARQHILPDTSLLNIINCFIRAIGRD